jgi:hypothetical protein
MDPTGAEEEGATRLHCTTVHSYRSILATDAHISQHIISQQSS